MYRAILPAALALLAANGSGCIVISALENKMIFFPSRQILATPGDIGLTYESVRLTAEDGVGLHGWWIPAATPRATLLFFHGNAGNIGDRLDSIRIFHELGLDVFILDYRGYGESEGSPSEQGTYADAEAAWRYLTEERGLGADDIVVFGRSLGGGVATWLAAQHPPRALIIESTFTSVPDLASEIMSFLPSKIVRTRYDNLANVERFERPLLVIHSRNDEIIPFDHGRRLYEAAREPKRFVELRGGHNDGFIVSRDRYVPALDEYLTEIL